MLRFITGVLLFGTAVLLPISASAQTAGDKEIKFVMHRIGNFRSEACCVGDFNKDGKLDVVAGPYLYLAPDWKPQKIRNMTGPGVDNKGMGYWDDFANIAIDVDGDGLLDVVSCCWMAQHSAWYRNTGKAGGLWPEKIIEKNGNFETGETWDLLGTGRRDVILPAVQRTVWYELGTGADGKRGFITHVVSNKLMDFGGGVGDVNGDGRPDIIRPNAWFEAPADPRHGKWIEHPLSLGGKDGKAEHTPQIWVYDVNGDGLPDIITSSAHRYGIYWYEQVRDGDKISWKQHVIDDTWSQAHSITMADLDGDGVPELIMGKRFLAHNGGDPGAFEPLGLYYYKLKKGPTPVWTKHVISYNQGIGAGMTVEVADINGDGKPDIVVTGKWGGPVWFENKGEQ
jgi:hypothetical protein